MDGPTAQLASLLLRARAHVFPQGWLDLEEILPYRVVCKWVSVAVNGLIRGVSLGFAREARRRVQRGSPSETPALAD